MTKLRNAGILMGAAVLLGACANYDLAGVKGMDAKGGAFNTALHSEYVRLAALEAEEADWSDAGFFNGKAQSAAMGAKFGPQAMSERSIPAANVEQMSAARARLINALAARSSSMPDQAAQAQAGFDCWMQEQEENFQPDHIAACRNGFFAALGALEAGDSTAKAPAAAAAPMVAGVPGPYVVTFELNSAKLEGGAGLVIKEAAKQAKAAKIVRVLLNGHTDLSGSAAYNMRLSAARTNAVQNALEAQGLSAEIMLGKNYGEQLPAVKTPDGRPEAANRRVEIIFQR